MTIEENTSPIAAVVYALFGGTFRLRVDPDYPKAALVLDDQDRTIGTASQIYADGGWAISTKPFGGYVPSSRVELVE